MQNRPGSFRLRRLALFLIFIAGLAVGLPAWERAALAQDSHVRQYQAHSWLVPSGPPTVAEGLTAARPRAKKRVGEMPEREHAKRSTLSPVPPDPPSSVSPFQPNVKWGGRTVAVDVSPA